MPGCHWTNAEVMLLRQLHPTHSNHKIALRLGRTHEAVLQMSMKLGLIKSREQISIQRSTINIKGLKAAARLTDTEAAYLAGIIDGEGCITVAFTRGFCMNWSVIIYNNSKSLMDWIAIRLDCPIHERKRVGRQLASFFIRIGGNQRVRDLLEKVLTYLVIKREQAGLALTQYYAMTSEERVAIVTRIRELNSNNRWVHRGTGANTTGRTTNYSR